MSHYGQVKKSCAFQCCDKTVMWLHTARPENPNTSKCLNFHEYHSNTPRHPPYIPQTPPRHLQGAGDANRQQQTPPDTNRQPQTPKDTDKCCLSTSDGVLWRLLSSVGISCSLEMSGGCLGDVWWVSGGYLKGIHGNRRHSDVFVRLYQLFSSFQIILVTENLLPIKALWGSTMLSSGSPHVGTAVFPHGLGLRLETIRQNAVTIWKCQVFEL